MPPEVGGVLAEPVTGHDVAPGSEDVTRAPFWRSRCEEQIRWAGEACRAVSGVARCWSVCGLAARCGLQPSEEGVEAGGEPFVAVVGPDVLAEGGQHREAVGGQ